MRIVSRTLAVLVCACMMSSVVLAVPSVVRNTEAADPIQLKVGIPQTVDNLNPLAGYNNIDYQSYILQFDFLYLFDADYNPVPAAAESWSHNPDGKVWTYNIRHGMTFHDDEPVTAHDVNWTFNLMLTDETAGSLYIDLLRNVTDIRALDDYTLQITSDTPKANMLGLMIPILPEHLWSDIPASQLLKVDLWSPTYFPDGPIGSGPFRLMEYEVDSFLRYVPHQNYYGGTVHFDELYYKIYTNPNSMLVDLQAGTIDVATMVPKESWTTLLDDDHIDGQIVPQLALHELGFNVCPPELRVDGASENYEVLNRSVRKAIAMSIDKDLIVEKCYFGYGEKGDVLIPPASIQYHYDLTPEEEFPFDIAAANALLNASGYTADEDDDGIRENSTNGVELSFYFPYATEYPEDEAAANRIYNWLLQIGIEAIPSGELESKLFVDWVQMKYDMFMWNWGTDVDPTFILSVMTTGQIPTDKNDWSAWSDSFYSNPYYDYLFIKQQTTIDIPARQQIVYEMQQMLYRDIPYVILCYPDGLIAFRDDKFTNFPEMTSDAISPFSGTAGGPWFYFEIIPIGDNMPPQDVDAGDDTIVALGETRSFTGSAYDPEDDELNWTWEFTEPDDTVNERYGQTVLYTFENEGTVTVKLSVSDEVNPAVSDSFTVTVTQIADPGWLAGYVTDDEDAPLSGATVSVTGTSTKTDSSGHYNMTLTMGTYDVTATAEGYVADTQAAVVEKGNLTMLNFSLTSSSGTLKGHVYDESTGEPIAGATVTAKVGSVTKFKASGTDGSYEILLVPEGTCDVSVVKSGYDTEEATVEITAGEETVLDIEMKPSSEGGGPLSTAALAAIAIIILVVAAVAAMLLMKRRKGGALAAEEPPPPEQPKE